MKSINLNKLVNTIQIGDCIEGMKSLPDCSVDFVIADPPYNLSKGAKLVWDRSVLGLGFGGVWAKVMQDWDNMELVEYFIFTFNWLKQIKRVLKPSGSYWIFGTYHNIGIINFVLQLLEMEILNEIIWFKRNSFPNLRKSRFTASHENLIWGHTGKKRNYFFNYEFTKTTLFPEDKIKLIGKQMRTVWDIPNNKSKDELKYGKHETQKPLKILNRIILSTTKKNWVGLIPFAGAGSECVSCKMNNRNFIGYEISSKYVKIAIKRLESIELKFDL